MGMLTLCFNGISHVLVLVLPSRPAVTRPAARLEQAYLDTVQPEDLEAMKTLEIDRLRKRFPSDHLKEVAQYEDSSIRSFALLFSSTDPDWVSLFFILGIVYSFLYLENGPKLHLLFKCKISRSAF